MNTEPQTFELRVDLSSQNIDLMEHLTWGAASEHGATSIFLGTVRDHDPQAGDVPVVAIEYSAHPGAAEVLRKAVLELCEEVFPADGVTVKPRVTVIHRVGRVNVGEIALLAIVSTAHRDPGIDLVPTLVERIKAKAPIWKRQLLDDGSSKWSNLP